MKAEHKDADCPTRQRRSDNSKRLLISLTAGCLVIGGALLYHHEHLPQSSPPLPAPASAPAASPAPRQPAAAVQPMHYPTPPSSHALQSVQPQLTDSQSGPSRRPVLRKSHWHDWSWEFAGKVSGGKFTWFEQAGRIDWSSVCSNYTRGSFIHRDCRKAARLVFAQLCSQTPDSPSCAAEQLYNPLSI